MCSCNYPQAALVSVILLQGLAVKGLKYIVPMDIYISDGKTAIFYLCGHIYHMKTIDTSVQNFKVCCLNHGELTYSVYLNLKVYVGES
jgi:hypothetical protein